jgi:hypothetical protein
MCMRMICVHVLISGESSRVSTRVWKQEAIAELMLGPDGSRAFLQVMRVHVCIHMYYMFLMIHMCHKERFFGQMMFGYAYECMYACMMYVCIHVCMLVGRHILDKVMNAYKRHTCIHIYIHLRRMTTSNKQHRHAPNTRNHSRDTDIHTDSLWSPGLRHIQIHDRHAPNTINHNRHTVIHTDGLLDSNTYKYMQSFQKWFQLIIYVCVCTQVVKSSGLRSEVVVIRRRYTESGTDSVNAVHSQVHSIMSRVRLLLILL